MDCFPSGTWQRVTCDMAGSQCFCSSWAGWATGPRNMDLWLEGLPAAWCEARASFPLRSVGVRQQLGSSEPAGWRLGFACRSCWFARPRHGSQRSRSKGLAPNGDLGDCLDCCLKGKAESVEGCKGPPAQSFLCDTLGLRGGVMSSTCEYPESTDIGVAERLGAVSRSGVLSSS